MEAAARTKAQVTATAAPRPPALPWAVRLKIFVSGAATKIALRADGTVNRFVLSLIDRQASASARPDRLGIVSADVAVDASRGLWARVFSPSAATAPVPVVVYFHGGGFVRFSAASAPFDALCRRFCRELGALVVSINYRLAPEHRYPAAYDDGTDVLRFLANGGLRTDGELAVPVDLSRCFLAGDSAGGNLAHHVARRWTGAASDDPAAAAVRIAGIVLLQPYFGGEERTAAELRLEGAAPVVNMRRSDWAWRAFLPEGATRDHPAAHVTGAAEPELPEAFPPALVVIGGFDPLQDWQRRYAEMLRRGGKYVQVVEFTQAIHGFYVFPELADAGEVVKGIKAFMDASASSSKPAA